MPAIALNHYNIRVPLEALPELRDFYCNALGLQEGARPPFRSFGFWLYAGGVDVLHLSLSRPGDVRTPGAGTLDHVAFTCVDFAAMCARLDALGVVYTIDEVPLLGQRQVFFQDPQGNGVELNFSAQS